MEQTIKQRTNSNISLWSRYRTALMGIAIICNMTFHSSIKIPRDMEWLRIIMNSTNIGVDLFLFLSGIGLYRSMKRHCSVKKFYKQRIIKIVIPSFIMVAVWGVCRDLIVMRTGIGQFFKDVTLISFWTDGVTSYWYLASILVLYAVYPIIYRITDNDNAGKHTAVMIISVMAFNAVYQVIFPKHYVLIEIFLTRIPVFLCGCYIGRRIYKEQEIKSIVPVSAVVFIASAALIAAYWNGIFKEYMFMRYVLGTTAMSLSLLTAKLFDIVKCKTVVKALEFVGRHTLEIYLIFMQVSRIAVVIMQKLGLNFDKYGIVRYVMCAGVYISLAVVYKRMYMGVYNKAEKKVLKKI